MARAGVQRADRDLATAAGMSDFLPKPLEPRRLIRCLRRHVEARRGQPLPVTPRQAAAAPAADAGGLGIAGIDEDAIAPSLRRDRALLLSMVRRMLAEFGGLAAVPAADLAPLLHKLRVRKSPQEVELLRKAVEITAAGRPGRGGPAVPGTPESLTLNSL